MEERSDCPRPSSIGSKPQQAADQLPGLNTVL
jgi:hypothetical protein